MFKIMTSDKLKFFLGKEGVPHNKGKRERKLMDYHSNINMTQSRYVQPLVL